MSNYSKIERKTANGLETILDLTGDTVTAESLKKGYTAHGANGDPILGTMEATSGGIVLSEKTTVTPETLGKGVTAYNDKGELITGTMTSSIPQYPDFSLEDADCVIEDEIISDGLYKNKPTPGKYIYLPNAISIGDEAFYCTTDSQPEKVYAPKCTTIGSLSFGNSSKLKFIGLPNLQHWTGGYNEPFYYNTGNTTTLIVGTNQSEVATPADVSFAITIFNSVLLNIFVPDQLLDAYMSHKCWGGFNSTTKDHIHPISEYGK